MKANGDRYDVGGVLLARPFKVRRLGHFGFNAVKMDEGRDFYTALLGFKPSDTLDFGAMPWAPKGVDLGDTRGYFMRHGTDHHAFVLIRGLHRIAVQLHAFRLNHRNHLQTKLARKGKVAFIVRWNRHDRTRTV
jgi:catechol 2,3-dioxygenase-like lactoylglutathione lyase family enzyme